MHERRPFEWGNEISVCIFYDFETSPSLFSKPVTLAEETEGKRRKRAWIGEVHVDIRSIRIT